MNDNQRVNYTTRGDSPCIGCTERKTACWDNCPKDERGKFGYKAWKAKLEEVKEKRKAYDNLNRRKRWQRKTF
jgi:Ni,Fe-hydrogenase I small subunit